MMQLRAKESNGFRSGFIAESRGIEATVLRLGTDLKRRTFIACRSGISHSA
ncbi:hypothetical protein ABIB14_001523 [Arthrobacter sp. UYEF3]